MSNLNGHTIKTPPTKQAVSKNAVLGKTREKKAIDDRVLPENSSLPEGRVSQSPHKSMSMRGMITDVGNTYRIVSPAFLREVIPIIRALVALNPDVSQALDNVVSLANSGHKIYFDRKVPTEQADAMRNHLENKRKDWAPGCPGIDGLVNKLFSQVMISGALSNEWIPNNTLTGIESCMLLDPEKIEFKLNDRQTKFDAYQRVDNTIIPNIKDSIIKLNPATYKYFSLTGDGESPYAIPPYLPVIPRIKTQNKMNNNIDFIVDTMGLIGFLEVLIQKPMKTGAISNQAKYDAYLNSLLTQAKNKVVGGLKDGVVVGFKDDHEFKFNTAAKNYDSVSTLYQENELQIASGAKQDAALWGRGYSTSETQISVVFMKLLAQLKNIQNIVKHNLEFGYGLELRLAGFKFDWLRVAFKPSTLQDELKYQQAQEYLIKNVKEKYLLGIIDQDMMADELGYETSAQKEPLVSADVLAGQKDQVLPTTAGTGSPSTSKRSAQKKKSEKTSKAKSKPAKK